MAKRKRAVESMVAESEGSASVVNESCESCADVPVVTEHEVNVEISEACACTGVSEVGRDFPVYEDKPLRIAKVPAESVTVDDMSSTRPKRPKVARLEKRSRTKHVAEEESVTAVSEGSSVAVPDAHVSETVEEVLPEAVSGGVSEVENTSEVFESAEHEEPLRIAAPMSEDQKQALESDEWFSRTRGCAFMGVKSPKPESKRPCLQDNMTVFSGTPIPAKEVVVSEDSDDRQDIVDADADYRLIHAHDLEDNPDENSLEPLDSGDVHSPDDSDDVEEPEDSVEPEEPNDLLDYVMPDEYDDVDDSCVSDGMEFVCLGFEGVPFIHKAQKGQCLCRNRDTSCVEVSSLGRMTAKSPSMVTEMPMYVFDGTVLGFAFKPYSNPNCDSELLDLIVYTNRGVYSMYIPASCQWRVNADDTTALIFRNDKFEWVLNNVPVANIEFYPVDEMDGYHTFDEDIDGVDVPCIGMLQFGDALYGQDMSIPVPFLRYVEIIDSVFQSEDFDPSELNFLTAYFRRL